MASIFTSEPRSLESPRLLHDPQLNKGTAFTADERSRYGLEGFLPPRVESLAEQESRVIQNVREKTTALEKYRYLAALQGENETLFYRVLTDHLEELLPIVYTPTVGQACIEWSRIYDRPRGLYVSALQHRGRLAEVLRHWPRQDVRLIVATDGGRILGLGDLGANGMGIPIGKLALYSACAGVPPSWCLPVLIDVGTDSESVRNDPCYLGERMGRLWGEKYDSFIDEFVDAAGRVFPEVILQFEDFNNQSAFRLLGRYQQNACCFNDDIQGTGAMGLAGLYVAARLTRRPLVDQRLLFVGAGEACLGIGSAVVTAMQRDGLTAAEAKGRCLFVDSTGLVVSSRRDLPAHKRPFAQDRAPAADLLATVREFAPTALIGASGQPGLFTPALLGEMARLNDRPIVFALSNPTVKAECTAEQAYASTGGRAIYASGSPFAPVTFGDQVHTPGQANNSYIFPGVGLGLAVARARRVTDDMFLAAAHALADQTSEADLEQGRIFPAASRMREVALAVSSAVASVAFDAGLARAPRPADLPAAIRHFMYTPEYVNAH